MLLFEITAFLRDSYRRLPRSTRVSLRSNDAAKTGGNTGSLNVASGSCNERPSAPSAAVSSGESIMHHSGGGGSIALATMATPAANPGGRRWSMALSSMGQSQTSAQSLQSITGDGHSIGWCSWVRYQIAINIIQTISCALGGVPGERKISFVLHEPDDESLDSSNTTLTFQVKFISTNLAGFSFLTDVHWESRATMRLKRNEIAGWPKAVLIYFDEAP